MLPWASRLEPAWYVCRGPRVRGVLMPRRSLPFAFVMTAVALGGPGVSRAAEPLDGAEVVAELPRRHRELPPSRLGQLRRGTRARPPGRALGPGRGPHGRPVGPDDSPGRHHRRTARRRGGRHGRELPQERRRCLPVGGGGLQSAGAEPLHQRCRRERVPQRQQLVAARRRDRSHGRGSEPGAPGPAVGHGGSTACLERRDRRAGSAAASRPRARRPGRNGARKGYASSRGSPTSARTP